MKLIIEKNINQLTESIKQINTIYKKPSDKRRGLINGIGSIAKTLFGTMDADDEKNIKEQLHLIKNNEQITQHAAKTQIKILNTTLTHINKLEDTLEHNNELLKNATKNIYNRISDEIKREDILEHFLIINAILTDLQRDIQDIMDFLTQIQNGILNPKITPIEKIYSELKEATPHLPQGTQFPFGLKIEEWNTIKKLITTSAYYDNTNIYTILQFPLITFPKYKIIKIIPLPIHDHDNIFVFTEVNQHIIAISTDRPTYMTITKENLNKCINVHNTYLCEPYSPIYIVNTNSLCEIQTYSHITKNADNCDKRYIKSNQTLWIALKTPNTWLYSTLKEQQIYIHCKNNKETVVVIKRTGKITLKENCKVIATDMTIKTKNVEQIANIQTYLPNFNLTFSKDQNTQNKKSPLQGLKFKKIIQDPKELMDLSNKLEEINKDVNDNLKNPFAEQAFVYPMTTSSIAVVIAIILAIILGIKLWKERSPF
ncbi:uncharacterized protein [Linepithema humile]|uniref:uncharacterized protein n=1 Tax=Linepithema humile TaxID=83485 RepID=UPI00351E6E37